MKLGKRIAKSTHRVICVVLALAVATSPAAQILAQTNAAAQAVRKRVQGFEQGPAEETSEQPAEAGPPSEQPASQPAAAPAEGAVDTTFVAPGATAVIVLRPAQLMTSEFAKSMPTEVATAAGLKYMGFDPADVDQVVAFTDMSNPQMPSYGMTFSFNKPFKAAQIAPQLRAQAQLGELNGKKYLQSQNPIMPSFYGPNNQTLVAAPDSALRQMVDAQGQPASSPFLDMVRQSHAGSDLYVAVDIAGLRPTTGVFLGMAKPQAPEAVQPLFDLPNLISSLELTLNVSGAGPTELVAHANDEAAADQIVAVLNDVSQKYQTNLKSQLAARAAASNDPIDQAMVQYYDRISADSLAKFIPTREGTKLTIFHSDGLDESQKKMLVAGLGIGAALLLPAQQAARQAAQRNASMNNMKQIIIAFMNTHDTRGSLPAHAIYKDGKPLLSWRVAILPFLEQNALYQQFNLDEPWDSDHNKALIAQMPDVYRNPNAQIEPGKTNYLAPVGKDLLMDGTENGIKLKQITDGTSKTIAVVEADPAKAVEWTKPDDWAMNADNPHDGLGNVRPNVWLAAFCDGHVEAISDTLDPNILRALFTRAGGEAVEIPPMAPLPAGPVPARAP